MPKYTNRLKHKSHYENVPFEVPEGWCWCRLDCVGEIVTGSTPPKDNVDYYGGSIPFYKPTDLEQGINTIEASDSLTELGFSVSRQLPEQSILVTCIGATIGKTGLIQKRGTCNQQINAIISNNMVLPEYLYYTCISGYMQSEIIGRASATTLPILNKNKFSEIPIPVPPIQEQQRIISKIETLFSFVIELGNSEKELISTISKAKSKILDLAIHGKLVPQDPNDEPAIELLKRINPKFVPCDNAHYENNTIEIPKNWEWAKLSDIAVSELGKTLDKGKNSGTPHNYLCAFNVKWCSFDFSVIKKILLEDEELERYKVRKGDLLICEGGDVGRAAIWESDQDIYYQNALHRVRFKNEINQYFYLYVMQFYKSLGMIDDVSGGVTIKHFTQNSMKKLSFPLPPIKEQYRIVSAINQYNTILDDISANL